MNDDRVEVLVVYYGPSVNGKQIEEYFTVSAELARGIQQIKEIITSKYSLEFSYMTMINDVPLTRVLKEDKKKRLLQDDIIRIIPMISGG
jgi:hypothetical protein